MLQYYTDVTQGNIFSLLNIDTRKYLHVDQNYEFIITRILANKIFINFDILVPSQDDPEDKRQNKHVWAQETKHGWNLCLRDQDDNESESTEPTEQFCRNFFLFYNNDKLSLGLQTSNLILVLNKNFNFVSFTETRSYHHDNLARFTLTVKSSKSMDNIDDINSKPNIDKNMTLTSAANATATATAQSMDAAAASPSTTSVSATSDSSIFWIIVYVLFIPICVLILFGFLGLAHISWFASKQNNINQTVSRDIKDQHIK